jgi:hypothetical protein
VKAVEETTGVASASAQPSSSSCREPLSWSSPTDLVGGHSFVLIGIGAIAVEGILEGAVIGWRLKEIAESETPDVDAFRRTLSWSNLGHFVLFAVVVWAMVVKPGA